MSESLWHGGVPGLKPGDLITPGSDRKHHDGCPWCEARKQQAAGGPAPAIDPLPLTGRVYCTTNRLYAKHYASLYGRGWLYRVEPVGDLVRSLEDTIETWTAEALRVVSVYEKAVLLTNTERRRLWREWTAADQRARLDDEMIGAGY